HDACGLRRRRLDDPAGGHRRLRPPRAAPRSHYRPPGPGGGATVELTPRTSADTTTVTRSPRSRWAYVVLVAVLVGLGVVVWQALTSASLYFLNADEAVEQRADLGDRRFRLQGIVLGETIEETADGVTFAVAFNGVK